MIALGQIHLQHGTSVYDARAKIRSLANALGYDPIEATRLATAVSEAARDLRREGLDPRIAVLLAMDTSPAQLVLDFESRDKAVDISRLAGFFDGLQRVITGEGFQRCRMLKRLPDPSFDATQAFVAEQRERIQTLSREELMAEIEQKNRDLERHSAQLEQTVARRTEQLEQATMEADAANKAKGDFLANMSHEIRTPMNAIIGLSDLCLRTELSDKQRDYLSKVHGSAIALLGIINDILDFSKIEAGKLDIEVVPFSIDEVLEDLATLVQVKTQQKGLELLFKRSQEMPDTLMGDPLRLGQVLVNLTNNAVKFTEKGEVLVEAELAEDRGDSLTLRFAVTDTGIGMTDQEMQKLFQSFSQADTSTTRKYGGTGLGLVICKQLVEMMGGHIWVDSEVGRGTTFGFNLVVGVGQGAQVKSFSPVAGLEQLRCLVVDDNETSREILSHYLNTFNFEVETESSGIAVAQRIQQGNFNFDLVVTDWMMPGLDGIELASAIRAHDSLSKQPRIILVSSFHGTELREKPGAENIDKYLAKPVSPSHLFDSIMECFGQKTERVRDSAVRPDHGGDSLASIRGANVLVTEDNEINQQVASELLEQAGLVVDIANHGQEAIDMIAIKDYDVVLMDIQMPIMDGYTATRHLRELGTCSDLPILAMTANATVADREKSMAAGMNAHINKPINPAELFKTLLTWVEPGVRAGAVMPAATGTDAAGSAEPDSGFVDIAAFDTAAGMARVGGNAAAYRRLLGKFVDNQGLAMTLLRDAMLAGDQELAVRTVHSLKGSAGALGITAVQNLAGNVEAILKEDVNGADDDVLQDLKESLDAALSLIRGAMPASDTSNDELPEPKEMDASTFDRLDLLQAQLEDFDSEAEDTLDALRTEFVGTSVAGMLDSVARAVSSYDMELAAQQLPEVVMKLKEQVEGTIR